MSVSARYVYTDAGSGRGKASVASALLKPMRTMRTAGGSGTTATAAFLLPAGLSLPPRAGLVSVELELVDWVLAFPAPASALPLVLSAA